MNLVYNALVGADSISAHCHGVIPVGSGEY